ncbi:M13 family metallopeptidase [Lactobacillus sp. ESL0731]|uniref:M13 family metallopeptidase n=1 Tax=unclassified Lactobacillus TaxID=2620435 RepID=UPI0023F79F25|nr:MULTISPECIES: M13 family metallopeptidase [unclassified Lactobacillus]WEV51844.1 M13 family metallopeptidase [Lactobacillus sp. ESL0700]WEV62974.1 M13 family metallopeptidase [Lactobacillus sp. ESL0731]
MKNISKVRGGSGSVLEPKVGTRPQDNLYLAVNSEWLQTAKIPADRSRYGSFIMIAEALEKNLMHDFADFASGKKPLPDVPNMSKAVELYKLANDFTKRNQDGAAPIMADLQVLEEVKDLDDLNAKAASLSKFATMPFSLEVEVDMKNTEVYVLYFSGPQVVLPDASTYKSPDAAKLLAVWEKQSVKLLELAGVDSSKAADYARKAVNFDKKLAGIVKSGEEWADEVKWYNPLNTEDFEAKFKNFKMNTYLDAILDKKPERIINKEPRFLDHVNELINEDTFAEIKAWMIVNFINDNAENLSQEFREASFPFTQAKTGIPELATGEKQAFHIADRDFSEVVGVYYGQNYFGVDAKKDVEDMIHRMLAVYEHRLQNNDWLSASTKEKAIAKLRALKLKIGYPDKIEAIYDQLQVVPADQGGSLYANRRSFRIAKAKYNFAKLQQAVDPTVWEMPGDMVNACYNGQINDLTFPAAILQKPFYDINQSRAANFGGIGSVIAHEISHAFDNNGAQFDEHGNMNNWWTKEDYAEFQKRTQAEIDLFDGIQYGPVKLNGKQMVSENIADQGGLTAAVEAAKNEGDDLQELFENHARIWMIKATPETIKAILSFDVHGPEPLRANLQAQCQDDFYKAFDVKPTDGMWLDPDKRVHIW